jgi:hypothetical protein
MPPVYVKIRKQRDQQKISMPPVYVKIRKQRD